MEHQNDLAEFGLAEEKPQILVAGPYISNYSLAKVNRGIGVGLAETSEDYFVNIWQNPSFGLDKEPSAKDLENSPKVAKILTDKVEDAEVVIYNSTPKDGSELHGLAALPGRIKLMYMAWEETVVPEAIINEMNDNLHGVMVASKFTKDILRRNGLRIPVAIVPNALNDQFWDYEPKTYPLKTKKKFKFLHISSARQRKGMDLLLQAYFAEFNGDDDVVLVIKSFPGPDNLVNDLLGKLKKDHPNPPEVLHIFNPDLTEEELIDLTHTCDVCVYPTRAEGFGLPIAEAMALGKLVITTAYSGHMDFCSPENSLLLDYRLQAATDSEMVNIGARWAEPDLKQLQEKLKFVHQNQGSEDLKGFSEKAESDTKRLNWGDSAQIALKFIDEVRQFAHLKQERIAVLTEVNTVGGIAEYSQDLYNPIQHSFEKFYFVGNSDATDLIKNDPLEVVRLWEQESQDFSTLLQWLEEEEIDILHVQHHSGYLSASATQKLLEQVNSLERKVRIYFTPHDTQASGMDYSQLKTELNEAEVVFVHKKADIQYLEKRKIENLQLFPLPFDDYPIWPKQILREKMGIAGKQPVIATHGIISFHKGLLQTAEAIAELVQEYPNLLWLAVNALSINNISSSDTFDQLQRKVKALGIEENVIFVTKFLDAMEVITLLEAADIGVLAYEEVGESASAAVRKFMASRMATIVTDIPMMAELNHEQEVYKIKDNDPKNISAAITELVENPEKINSISQKALETSSQYSWEVMGRELLQTY